MIGLNHFIVISFGIIGLFLGGVLVDLDHRLSIEQKWNGFLHPRVSEGREAGRGIFHNPVVMLSIIAFSLSLAIGLLLHLIMDFVELPM